MILTHLNHPVLPRLQTEKEKAKARSEITSPGTPFDQLTQKILPSSGPWSKALLEQAEHAKLAKVQEDLGKRRSQSLKNGFREPQCSRKGCLGCSVNSPILSPLVIRNLGASFCNLDEDNLTDAALNKVSAPRGEKPIKKKTIGKFDVDAKQEKRKPNK
jgi:hypothetical protein